MKNINFNLIVDKVVQRQIKLLTILSNSEQPHRLDSLSNQLLASKKTIISDINVLLDILPTDIIISKLDNKSISIMVSDRSSLLQFMYNLAKESPLFYIIESIFNGEEHSSDEYASILYVSEVTMRVYIKKLEEVVKQFNLKLSFSPVRLIGDEVNIRCFFFSFFKISEELGVLTPTNKMVTTFYETIDEIKNTYKASINMDFKRAMHWLRIVEKRVKLGKFVSLKKNIIDEQKKKNSFIHFSRAYEEKVKVHLGISNLIIDEIVFSYLVRLDTLVYTGNMTNNRLLLDEFKITDEKMIDFIKEINEALYLDFKSDEELINRIKIYLSINKQLSYLSDTFQKNSYELKNQIQLTNSSIYNQFLLILYKFNQRLELGMIHVEDIASSLALLFVGHRYETNKIKVLLCLSGESTSLSYIKGLILNRIPRTVTCIFSYNDMITEELLKKNDVRICIHNYELEKEIENYEFIQISSIPSKIELINLADMLIQKSIK